MSLTKRIQSLKGAELGKTNLTRILLVSNSDFKAIIYWKSVYFKEDIKNAFNLMLKYSNANRLNYYLFVYCYLKSST